MPLLIDAYNVLHTTGVLPRDLAGIGLMDLCRLIAVSRWKTEPALLVCDGSGPDALEAEIQAGPAGAGLVAVHFAGHGADAADRFIESAIQRDSAPRRLSVVSSDRRVRTRAQRYRCRTLTSETFLERLTEDHDRFQRKARRPIHAFEIPLDPLSIDWWLDYFGIAGVVGASLSMIPASHDVDPSGIDDESSDPLPEETRKKPTMQERLDESDEIDVDEIDPGDLFPPL